MKISQVIVICLGLVWGFLVISEAMSVRNVRSLGMELHCRCIKKETRTIKRYIKKLELIPASSHCQEMEVIATIKKTGVRICLDPEAPWVKEMIDTLLSTKKK